ncbi:MAG: pantetheine-phosphate adenylyltransferase [Nitrosopumilus sp.]|jgi:pantetheine-phosphate adenylyltransferase|nr:pantetheine-phosphate adenylyltransferase [Nitrosopumilus sp.]RCL30444.1 MAG: pantetheine-phosphate adenylyltransferase [Nitrosopumilus sp.]|tara:strand:- start:569 stop:1045 length:477 start_codon:yes stop_codon:yes gene_type:complete
MSKFSLIAMGGTFDIIHHGHITLLSTAFDISEKVIIGLTSDEFVQKKGKNPIHKYDERLKNLTSIIFKKFPNSYFEISQLNNDFGPAVFEKEVQALVVSDETKNQGNILNKLRTERNISPVEIIVVPMTLAKDGKRISTTRIKNSEIDSDGNLLPIDK